MKSIKWAVTIDNAFQLFDALEDAERVYNMVGGSGGEGDELCDTPFGSAFLVPESHLENMSWLETECDLIEYMWMTDAELDDRVRTASLNKEELPDLF